MKLTTQELLRYRPCNNYVLLKPAIDTSKFKYGTVEFYSPISMADGKPYDPFTSAPIVCSVIATPKRLIYGTTIELNTVTNEIEMHPDKKKELVRMGQKTEYTESEYISKMMPDSMQWKTPMELKADDIVWCSANAMMIAERYHQTIEADGVLYYLIKYENIYLKKLGDKVKMVNGWVLVESMNEEHWSVKYEKSGLIIPDSVKKEKQLDKYAIIRYIDEPVQEYIFGDRSDYPNVHFKVGDIVQLLYPVNRKLEPGAKYFSQDENLIVSRRCNFLAIMGNGKKVNKRITSN